MIKYKVNMNIAIIVAAGSGSRMNNTNTPKQFIPVCDVPLFLYSIKAFENNKQIDAIIVVVNKNQIEVAEYLSADCKLTKLVKGFVPGGDTRQQSVLEGLKAAKDIANDDSVVLIHDAARPLISDKIINENILAVREFNAAVTVIPATDTLLQSNDGESISSSLKRNEIYQAQTPQSFKFKEIFEAHLEANKEGLAFTDDASLYNHYKQKPLHMVLGDRRNFKVTTEGDLLILKNYLNK